MLTLEVVPERSLGCEQWEFIVGMHFSQASAVIQSQVGIIKIAQVIYSNVQPITSDIALDLPLDGIRLFFDSLSQRLKIIEVYNLKLVKLKYCGLFFNSPEILPTIGLIEHSFGATHPGIFDPDTEHFILNFRGLTFHFPVDPELQCGGSHSLPSLEFPHGKSPLVSKLQIYCGPSIEDAYAPELPLPCYSGQLYANKVEVLRGDSYTKGIKLQLSAGTNSRLVNAGRQQFERVVFLGYTVQDVITALGAPSKVFYKSEDKMRIHRPNARRRMEEARSDYFFNYFTLGLDILFDANFHCVKKIVMHTNYPGHYTFNMYVRCEFEFSLNGNQINAYSLWNNICKILTPSDRPVVLNRASSTNTTNPFGSTLCYGFQDLVFEILPNQFIASLTIHGDGRPYEYEMVEA